VQSSASFVLILGVLSLYASVLGPLGVMFIYIVSTLVSGFFILSKRVW
jgi:hypothetical protein